MKKSIAVALACVFSVCNSFAFSQDDAVDLQGELRTWHKITLVMQGPSTSEQDVFNPFRNYRVNVRFTHDATGREYVVPGYYAADGNSGETSADSGNIWKVHFAPDLAGEWKYEISFRKGEDIFLLEKDDAGEAVVPLDGRSGIFTVKVSDKEYPDNRYSGGLVYDGTRYLKFAGSGDIFLKTGPDSPENFLSYADFDGDFKNDGEKDDLVKTWAPHIMDWKEGCPVWKGDKGKGMIGALNYLHSKGMNSFSFITMNVVGDDRNVFPYVNYNTFDRFDCSKLDQWEVVFEYADRLGMFLHFKLLESENQGLLDNGAIGAMTKLYFREMIARFSHHLALNWNVCEESGEWEKRHITPPMDRAQRLAAASYLKKTDPYDHHIVVHNGIMFYDILGKNSDYSGISLQTWNTDFDELHGEALKWIRLSEESGKQWAVAVDEPGDYRHGVLTDGEDPGHDDARINALWGAFMAGAWGTEWYFGYMHPESDLSCQDYRARDGFWDQCRYLTDFFKKNSVPLGRMDSMDELVKDGDYCLADPGDVYVVMLREGKGHLDLTGISGEFTVDWYNPRTGEYFKDEEGTVKAGGKVFFEETFENGNQDWVILLRRPDSCYRKVLYLTGHTDRYHSWYESMDFYLPLLRNSGKYDVDCAIVDSSTVRDVDFSRYDAVVLCLNQMPWDGKTKKSFERFVRKGGGLVVLHEADNAFPEWKEFNRMTGVGGWGDRDKSDGPYLYWKDGKIIRDNKTDGPAGSHGERVPFVINVREKSHPVMSGLPERWTHSFDELYGNLRGPAENVTVLATAYSDPATGGTGKEEPVFMVIGYGDGKVFHSVLGHTHKGYDRSFNNSYFGDVIINGLDWTLSE